MTRPPWFEFGNVERNVYWIAISVMKNAHSHIRGLAQNQFLSVISSRHLQRLWGASGDFWQSLWDKVLNQIGDDEFTVYVYGNNCNLDQFFFGSQHGRLFSNGRPTYLLNGTSFLSMTVIFLFWITLPRNQYFDHFPLLGRWLNLCVHGLL